MLWLASSKQSLCAIGLRELLGLLCEQLCLRKGYAIAEVVPYTYPILQWALCVRLDAFGSSRAQIPLFASKYHTPSVLIVNVSDCHAVLFSCLGLPACKVCSVA
jgi:hypothetical protein